VIYAESHFRDGQTSAAGALGLMQLTPATARYIAHKSGGTQFVVDDLATPQVNIAYGAYYLRYLLRRYGGNQTFALAAYNAGEGNVDRWIAAAQARDRAMTVTAIPYSETRAYVSRVLTVRRQYRSAYADQLGRWYGEAFVKSAAVNAPLLAWSAVVVGVRVAAGARGRFRLICEGWVPQGGAVRCAWAAV
jgi:soluble lytic murein transglycosylase-like protein